MLERVLIAGSGGQGIVLVGKLLAAAAVKTVPHITFYPAYGAEVRGGTSNCQVILSTGEIASPVAEELDALILMNQASAKRFGRYRSSGGLALVNSSLCEAPRQTQAVAIPATDLANQLGDVWVANFIMLGAYLARRPIVLPSEIEACAEKSLSSKGREVVEINLRAFRAGLKL